MSHAVVYDDMLGVVVNPAVVGGRLALTLHESAHLVYSYLDTFRGELLLGAALGGGSEALLAASNVLHEFLAYSLNVFDEVMAAGLAELFPRVGEALRSREAFKRHIEAYLLLNGLPEPGAEAEALAGLVWAFKRGGPFWRALTGAGCEGLSGLDLKALVDLELILDFEREFRKRSYAGPEDAVRGLAAWLAGEVPRLVGRVSRCKFRDPAIPVIIALHENPQLGLMLLASVAAGEAPGYYGLRALTWLSPRGWDYVPVYTSGGRPPGVVSLYLVNDPPSAPGIGELASLYTELCSEGCRLACIAARRPPGGGVEGGPGALESLVREALQAAEALAEDPDRHTCDYCSYAASTVAELPGEAVEAALSALKRLTPASVAGWLEGVAREAWRRHVKPFTGAT